MKKVNLHPPKILLSHPHLSLKQLISQSQFALILRNLHAKEKCSKDQVYKKIDR